MVGINSGLIPVVLAEHYQSVVAMDRSKGKVDFVRDRVEQMGLSTVRVQCITDEGKTRVEDGGFDLVYFQTLSEVAPEMMGIANACGYVSRILRRGGIGVFRGWNPLTPSMLSIKPQRVSKHACFSLRQWRKVMERSGGEEVERLACIPNLDLPPMFFLPLGSRPACSHFLRNAMEIIQTSSPDVKKRYRLALILAKTVLTIGSRLGLGTAIGWLLPSYVVIGRFPGGTKLC